MLSEPRIVQRDEQPYLAARGRPARQELAAVIPGLLADAHGGMAARGVEPSGPPFVRYNLTAPSGPLEVEVGFPVEAGLAPGPDERLVAGTLPAGRYLTLIYRGDYSGLVQANATLQAWATERRLAFAVSETDAGRRWGCRLEVYLTDPSTQPDPETWETEVAYLLAGG